MTFAVRAMQPADVPSLLDIENRSFSSAQWDAEDFLKYECFVAELDGKIAGFLVSREIYPGEREILNLAVAPEFRRRGAATALIFQELERAKEIFLEVRESNTAAQSLYRKFGFTDVGRRDNYYHSPAETAIVMKMKWC